MMTKNEALKMAIELLECLHITEGRINVIVDACKEVLEQPAQEPLTRAQQVIRANNTAQPAQEPVGWIPATYKYNLMSNDDEYDIKFARAVLAKAKEKNYYGPT